MEKEDEKFIRAVNKVAMDSAKQGFDPFGALLVKEGQQKASSIDKCIKYSDPTAHAELILISEYCRTHQLIDLQDYTLYCNVEPCVMCSGAIHWAKIKRVVFCIAQESLQKKSKGKAKPSCKELINTGYQKIEIVGPFLEEEGLQVLHQYPFLSKKERHKDYYKSGDGTKNSQE